jgi:hypothetical protein
MRLAILAAATLFCAAGAASAETSQAQNTTRTNAKEGGRVVFVCDTSAETRRNWLREHGELTFVSADELARAQAAKETWSVPRCITATELQRYESAWTTARVQRTRAD